MLTGSSSAMRLLFLLGGLLSVACQRQYTIVNNCPNAIEVYSRDGWEAHLNPTASFVKNTDANTYFYTSTNGGNSAQDATRVGFYSGLLNQYYILKNWDSFNTGVRVQPNHAEINGLCPPVTCDAVTCTTAFVGSPNLNDQSAPPKPPLYSCPSPPIISDPSYTITFCPSGTFPGDNGRAAAIHPNGNPKKCMDVRGAVYDNGTPVQIYNCNGTGAQKWVYNKGSTHIRVANTNYCLDSSNPPTRNGVGMKIWQCYDNLPAQEWSVDSSENQPIPIREGTGYCLDLPNGVLNNWNQLQVWQCATGNTNQLWSKGLF